MAGSNIRAFYVSASGVTIKNLTIKNVNYEGFGGAIYFRTSGTVTNCSFTDNNASLQGGAIYFTSNSNVVNCNFINNHAKGDGGAIICEQALDVKNCLFDSNQVKGLVFQQCCGGAIRAVSISVDGSRFINNCAEDYGGAIYAKNVTLTNIPSYFIGNVAEDNKGGAIYTDTITNPVSNIAPPSSLALA